MIDSALLTNPDTYVSLVTLTAMEIVLGIDNIVFLSILTSKLPPAQQPKARSIGLTLALGSRLALLFAIAWVMSLTRPLFEVLGEEFSGRDLILLAGGLFLVAKATCARTSPPTQPSPRDPTSTRIVFRVRCVM